MEILTNIAKKIPKRWRKLMDKYELSLLKCIKGQSFGQKSSALDHHSKMGNYILFAY